MQLPADSPAVMITQHMPPDFTSSYAKRLDGLCRIRVIAPHLMDRLRQAGGATMHRV